MGLRLSIFILVVGQISCQKMGLESFLEKFSLELLMIPLLALLLWNFLKGKEHNTRIYNEFLKPQIPFLTQHFQYFGSELVDGEALKLQPHKIEDVVEQERPYFFKLFLTGRMNCKYALLSIVTKRRQDLLVSLFYSLLFPEKDRFYLEISLADMPSPKGILYLVKARQAKKLLEEFEDMRSLCSKYSILGLSATNLSVYAEYQDIADYLLDPSILEVITSNAADIESVEISDCVQSEIDRGVTIKLHALLNTSKEKQEERVKNILSLALRLADKYLEYSPPKRIAEKLQEKRKEFYSQKNKEKSKDSAREILAKRWENMSEEEKKKRQQMEEKRMRKKASNRVFVKKG